MEKPEQPKRKNTIVPRSFRFTPLGDHLLGQLASRRGLGKTGFIEMIVRDMARQEGLLEENTEVKAA